MREILNAGVLEQMAEDTSPDLMPMMLQVYYDELETKVTLLHAAYEAQSFEELSEQAHAIKSASGTFGADRLYDAARDLEIRAKTAPVSMADVSPLYESVVALIEQTRTEFEAYQKTL